jgi:hypothetical protein
VTDGNGCQLNMTRDCAKDGCVVSAIMDFAGILLPSVHRSSLPEVNDGEALAFLVHFIGDMHNPLHVLGMDRGGNSFPVKFNRGKIPFASMVSPPSLIPELRRRMNMHRVWDSELIGKWIRYNYKGSRYEVYPF